MVNAVDHAPKPELADDEEDRPLTSEEKIEELNAMLREGTLGAHRYDMSFGKVWHEIVSERVPGGTKKNRAPAQLGTSGRMGSDLASGSEAESGRDEGADETSLDPRREGETPAKRASASSRQGFRDLMTAPLARGPE